MFGGIDYRLQREAVRTRSRRARRNARAPARLRAAGRGVLPPRRDPRDRRGRPHVRHGVHPRPAPDPAPLPAVPPPPDDALLRDPLGPRDGARVRAHEQRREGRDRTGARARPRDHRGALPRVVDGEVPSAARPPREGGRQSRAHLREPPHDGGRPRARPVGQRLPDARARRQRAAGTAPEDAAGVQGRQARRARRHGRRLARPAHRGRVARHQLRPARGFRRLRPSNRPHRPGRGARERPSPSPATTTCFRSTRSRSGSDERSRSSGRPKACSAPDESLRRPVRTPDSVRAPSRGAKRRNRPLRRRTRRSGGRSGRAEGGKKLFGDRVPTAPPAARSARTAFFSAPSSLSASEFSPSPPPSSPLPGRGGKPGEPHCGDRSRREKSPERSEGGGSRRGAGA